MSVNRELDLMDYFSRELEYLRREGKDFGKKYPQVASRLDLRESESLDPHVERLIESFAFLSARVRRDIDRDYSQIANNVLDKFCPSLLQPIPSLTIVNLKSNEKLGKLTNPLKIPRHSKLSAHSDTNGSVPKEGYTCIYYARFTSDMDSLGVKNSRIGVFALAQMPSTAKEI